MKKKVPKIELKNKETIELSLDVYNKIVEMKEIAIEKAEKENNKDLALALRCMSVDLFIEWLLRKEIMRSL
ncbi:MAG: hypothetical protein AB1485_00185 [Candidatus Thermoplasmatota archaeon]